MALYVNKNNGDTFEADVPVARLEALPNWTRIDTDPEPAPEPVVSAVPVLDVSAVVEVVPASPEPAPAAPVAPKRTPRKATASKPATRKKATR